MNIFVIGSGGREHALVWKLAQSEKTSKIYCAPGNAGIAELAECLPIAVTDIEALAAFAKEKKIDLTVVGPESSLVAGVVDLFTRQGLTIFGPNREAARLEGSKVFSKKFLKKYGIPTADFQVFTEAKAARDYIAAHPRPLVVKADGLAAGKGVFVCAGQAEALQAVGQIMEEKLFGDAGREIIIEECLRGEEASFLAFVDGETVTPLPSSQDHKAIFDGDRGPNTGGMGAYSPAPVVSEALRQKIMDTVMLPTVAGLRCEGIDYRGVLYAGLMIDGDDIEVLEFNCRFGDPETQPLLMRVKSDLVDIMLATCQGRLRETRLEIDPRPTVCVVMAAGGYPDAYESGKKIKGLKKAAKMPGVMAFQAGTKFDDERIVTAGGRVLGVTARGKNLSQAIDAAYGAVRAIRWPGVYYRRDIGLKALRRQVKEMPPKALIIMGSDSDLPVMRAAADFLRDMAVPWAMTVASAHRTPARAAKLAKKAARQGVKVIIAGAGMSAHLAGVIAAHTDVPVIGVPLDASSLHGLDALLSTVQMPPGVPVATMGIGKAGAKNAAVLACRILALSEPGLAARLATYRQEMAREVEMKAARLATDGDDDKN
jgi:phosphoribosylamine--glycine ligase